MGIFRRKRRADTDAPENTGAAVPAEDGSTPTDAAAPPTDAVDPAPTYERAGSGPSDRSEVTGVDGYIDLGALWLPAVSGLMLTMEVDESTGEVTAVRVHHETSVLQLQVFAAPRSAGIWDEIRAELVTGVQAQGGSVEASAGPLGAEVLAHVPGRGADGRTVRQPMRFLGVDGPRWFLRAVVSGPAASDPDLAAPLVELTRRCVVVRGTEPMGPRELLPLALPAEPEQADPGQEPPADGAGPPVSTDELNPFERGPEMTETR